MRKECTLSEEWEGDGERGRRNPYAQKKNRKGRKEDEGEKPTSGTKEGRRRSFPLLKRAEKKRVENSYHAKPETRYFSISGHWEN